jgi:hypothetical protein
VDVTARELLITIALICQPVRGEQPSFNRRMTRVFMEGLGGQRPLGGGASRGAGSQSPSGLCATV